MSSFKLPSPEDSNNKTDKQVKSASSSNVNSLPSFEDLLSEFEDSDWNKSQSKEETVKPLDNKELSADDAPSLTRNKDNKEQLPETFYNASENDNEENRELPHEDSKVNEYASGELKESSDVLQENPDEKNYEQSNLEHPESEDVLEENEDLTSESNADAILNEEEQSKHPDEFSEEEMEDDWLMGVGFGSETDEEDLQHENKPSSEKHQKSSKEKDGDMIAKEFFTKLKDKISSLIKKDREKPKKPKKKKDGGSYSKENPPKKKMKLPKEIKSVNRKMIAYIGIGILIPVLFFIFLLISQKSFVSISDIEQSIKHKDKDTDETIQIQLEGFGVTDDRINFTVKNEGEMSANFSMSATFKEHSKNPFSVNKIECESDIIHLDPDGKANESFTCQKSIGDSSKYKLDVNIEKF